MTRKRSFMAGLPIFLLVTLLYTGLSVHAQDVPPPDAGGDGAAAGGGGDAAAAGGGGDAAAAGGGGAAASASAGESIGKMMVCASKLKDVSVRLVDKATAQVDILSYEKDGEPNQKPPGVHFHAMKNEASQIEATEHFSTLQVYGNPCLAPLPSKIGNLTTFTVLFPEEIKNYKTLGIFDYDKCSSLAHIILDNTKFEKLPNHTHTAQICNVPVSEACTPGQVQYKSIGHCKEPLVDAAARAASDSPTEHSTPKGSGGSDKFAFLSTFTLGLAMIAGLVVAYPSQK